MGPLDRQAAKAADEIRVALEFAPVGNTSALAALDSLLSTLEAAATELERARYRERVAGDLVEICRARLGADDWRDEMGVLLGCALDAQACVAKARGARWDAIMSALDLGLQAYRNTPSRSRFVDAVEEVGRIRSVLEAAAAVVANVVAGARG